MYTLSEVKEASKEYFKGDELAANVFATKYALTNEDGQLLELTPDDMHKRIAREFARIESKYPNPMSYDEIYDLLKGFSKVVPQGSPMSAIGNDFQVQSLSNCFVIESPHDSYGGILKADQELVQIAKRRGGIGFDISSIRPKGLTTANAAKTTDGIEVFMDRFSNSCREVAQNGRRGALMLTISVNHPQIEDFIKIKQNVDRVTGANISIRLTNEFMTAATQDTEYTLRWPVDAKIEDAKLTKVVRAREIWDKIIEAAHGFAEPGLLFWDNIVDNSPADIYKDFGYGTTSTNPCITGDTLIAVADGRNAVSIKQLVEEGNDVPVYSTNPVTGRTEIKMGRNPRLTKKQQEIWMITFDDGSTLKATKDHNIMVKTKDGLVYKELKDLVAGESVVPFNSFNSNGYRQITNSGAKLKGDGYRNRRQYRLVHEFIHGPTDSKTYAIHHKDFNSFNDRIENLEVMTHESHMKLHSENMKGEMNPYHNMSNEWKKNFASHPGEKNGRYKKFTNEELILLGKDVYAKHGKLTKKIWKEAAKEKNAPMHLGSNFRFGSFKNFKSIVIGNHKVSKVEKLDTLEDVYNITVDDNHNYCVITSKKDENFIASSGVCIKNCGELPLCPLDSCRLLLINLFTFVKHPFTPQAEFDFVEFSKVAAKAQRLMDDMVDLELEKIDKILAKIDSDPEPDEVKFIEKNLWTNVKKKASTGRRTGTGVTAVGDTIAALGLRYGSDASIEVIESIYKALALSAYKSSCVMAKERGKFAIHDHSLEEGHPFLSRLWEADPELYELSKKYGRRNISLLTTAPAGSVSTLTQTTSGIEPAYLLHYTRRKKINALEDIEPDFIDQSGDRWINFDVYHHKYKEYLDITGKTHDDVESSPFWKSTSNDIDWVQKIKLQAAAQKWVCHAISNTCNVPSDTSVDTVRQVYEMGWKTGCKGVTVYRDGSRSGVLVSTDSSASKEQGFEQHNAPKRPEVLPCEIHQVTIKGEDWTILVGLMEGKPYEIIGGHSKFVEIPKKFKEGILRKKSRKTKASVYDLELGSGEEELKIKDVVSSFENPNHSSFTRVLSLSLRHGAPIHYIVEQLQKGDKDMDLFSFSKVISRVLKKYIEDGTKAGGSVCSECQSEDSLYYSEGCVTCTSCGYSKCS